MACSLTLTKAERAAMDWVGGRYSHGFALCEFLCDCQTNRDDEDDIWDYDGDVTFTVPEHLAWSIVDIINEDDQSLACFAGPFADKLREFANNVV